MSSTTNVSPSSSSATDTSSLGVEQLERIDLIAPRPYYLRLDFIFVIVIYSYVGHLYMYDSKEFWLPGTPQLAFVGAIIFHALTYLIQQWSIPLKRQFSYRTVTTIQEATHLYIPRYDTKKQIPALVKLQTFTSVGNPPSSSSSSSSSSSITSTTDNVSSSSSIQHQSQSLLRLPPLYFEYNSLRYELLPESRYTIAICAPLPVSLPLNEYLRWEGWTHYLSLNYLGQRYGPNYFDIPLPEFLTLFQEHAEAPFFVFQIFCVILWSLDEYIWYPLFMLFMLISLEATQVFLRIQTAKQLRGMRPPPIPLYVYREKTWKIILSNELVPLDIVSLTREPPSSTSASTQGKGTVNSSFRTPPGTVISRVDCPADVLLVQGTVVVNEAMLTGENTPQLKEAIGIFCQGNGNSGNDTTNSSTNETTKLSTPKDSSVGTIGMKNDPNDTTTVLNAFLDSSIAGDRSHIRSIVYGGSEILQHRSGTPSTTATVTSEPSSSSSSPGKTVSTLKAPDNGAIAIVLRTGARSSQGIQLRTIMHASDPVSTADREGLIFIFALLILGIVSAGYVLHEGLKDTTRDRWKLILHCIMIITSVVPPDLPMQLSLAVSASLTVLSKKGILCTTPSRVPWAGRVTAVAFDKTGTLTRDEFKLEGIDMSTGSVLSSKKSSSSSSSSSSLILPQDFSLGSILVLAGCHSLVAIPAKELPPPPKRPGVVPPPQPPPPSSSPSQPTVPAIEIIGDPIEKAAMQGIGWTISLDESITPLPNSITVKSSSSTGNNEPKLFMSSLFSSFSSDGHPVPTIKVLKRWPFSSSLRRMTAGIQLKYSKAISINGSKDKITDGFYIVTKGAPEVIETLLETKPVDYTRTHQKLSSTGARILALAYKPLSTLDNSTTRTQAESKLIFAGFMVASCPLKTDSKRTITELQQSNHRVLMITGDAPLTALSVAKQIGLGPPEFLDDDEGDTSSRNGGNGTSSSSSVSSPVVGNHAFILDAPAGQLQLVSAKDNGNTIIAKDTEVTSSLLRTMKGLVCITGRALETLESLAEGNNDERTLNGITPPSNSRNKDQLLASYCRAANIFARVSPGQKERIIDILNTVCGDFTAMVGDGSNDTGALKKAHIGLAVVSNPALERKYDSSRMRNIQARMNNTANRNTLMMDDDDMSPETMEALLRKDTDSGNDETEEDDDPNSRNGTPRPPKPKTMQEIQEDLNRRLKELEQESALDGGASSVTQLGDASMAAPFTSKLPTPASLVWILRQGRCTLVTAQQMYKILAVNCLLLSYQLSVLHLNNVRMGDSQHTFVGMASAAFFLFLSWAKPVNKLSTERPQPTVFHGALLASIFSQAVVHLSSLMIIVNLIGFDAEKPSDIYADNSTSIDSSTGLMMDDFGTMDSTTGTQQLLQQKLFTNPSVVTPTPTPSSSWFWDASAPVPSVDGIPPDPYKPNTINSAVFLFTTVAQTCTFIISYHGLPFMEPLTINTLFARGGILVYAICVIGALDWSDDVREWLRLVPFENEQHRYLFALALIGDFVLCYVLEKIIRQIFRGRK